MPDAPRSLAAVERAARLAGPDATIQAMRALAGGTHALTTLIRTANPETEVILREFPPGDDAATRETKVLRALDGLGGLAPRLLASDTAHVTSDGSWLLISRLPGTAGITPRHPAAQADQLGRTLARVHRTPLARLADLPSVFDRPDGARTGVSGPAASIVAAGWDSLASTPPALVHHDFWSGKPNYRDLGRTDLTAAELRSRHTAWTEQLLTKIA
jgi:hypothetical protein